MSLISNFISNHLLSALEAEFQSHEPEIQAMLVAEIKALVDKANDWLSSKLSPHQPT